MDIKASGGETALPASQQVQARGLPLKESTAAGRDLSFYRRTAFPSRASSVPSGADLQVRGGSDKGGFRKVEGGGTFGDALFRSKATRAVRAQEGGGVVRGTGEEEIDAAQRAAALRKTGGIFSPRFLGSNPLLSPSPVPLPSLESMSVGGGVVGLPNGEVGGGGLSTDLLRALQKYRVAAEEQG